jgi:ketosteroid isomerase-like protein
MQSSDQNKKLAAAFCDLYTKGDWDALAELLSDDFIWKAVASQRRQSPVLAGVPPLNESPGYDKQETLAVFRNTQEMCVDGRFDLTPAAFTSEGDRVAFEATGYAVNKVNGRVYDNRYHHLMRVRDGKIVELREYQDTLLVFDVWMAP